MTGSQHMLIPTRITTTTRPTISFSRSVAYSKNRKLLPWVAIHVLWLEWSFTTDTQQQNNKTNYTRQKRTWIKLITQDKKRTWIKLITQDKKRTLIKLITQDKKRTWICEIKLTFVPSCAQMKLQLLDFHAVFKTWPTFHEQTSIFTFRKRR